MWSLFQEGRELSPMIFSNGKSQEDVVNEVLDSIKEGYKIIFIKGMCGTGKSAIALNLARNIGKASIVVPIKSLQEQYMKDYTDKLYLLNKDNKEKLKISSIVGRNNFKCKYLEQNQPIAIKQEKDTKLSDIFYPTSKNAEINRSDKSADNNTIPCKIEIKEKNSPIIKDYLRQNKSIKLHDFASINEVRRMSIAPVCEYWSPIFPKEFDVNFQNSQKISYKGLNDIEFVIHRRKPGCKYYEQYHAYDNADAIIFNSLKYKLETIMNRKPNTEIEIIDECDEFLDSFANQERISINRLIFSLNMTFPNNIDSQEIIDSLNNLTSKIKKEYENSKGDEIIDISSTPIEELLLTMLRNNDLLNELGLEESNYLFHLDAVAKTFYDFLNETFFSIEKTDNDLIISLVTINLKKRFQELIEKNKIIVMMSGTIHSEKVLETIYGLSNFKIIDAETTPQGELIKCKHGYEINCKYSNFQSGQVSRETYLKAFSKTISSAKKPVLVHITSFSDLPTQNEKNSYNIDNLPTKGELIYEQKQDPLGQRVIDFKNKKTNILFTTKCSRGIDFPGDTCNSIVISRFPYPNISSIFWKILKKTNPEHFMEFYMDKANRDLLQKVYRGLRSKDDKVYLLSPDIRVIGSEI